LYSVSTMQKLNKYSFVLSLLVLCAPIVPAQQIIKGEDKKNMAYTEARIMDPDYGILLYEKLNFTLGGDSVRNSTKGYACQGWVEDFYANGQMLHRGFYVDGQLKIYKNYFDNGQLEREFKVTDLKRCTMKIYFKDGKIKADIEYYNGGPVKEQDFYANGQLKYIEEHTKNMDYLIQMKSYTDAGKPQSIFEITDTRKKTFYKKEYGENGLMKEEGSMKYSSDILDYVKDGQWKFYDDNGTLKSTDNYVNGQGGNSN
jgi:antitoxin component YwqK of YwqJK toxin-antitoxin module